MEGSMIRTATIAAAMSLSLLAAGAADARVFRLIATDIVIDEPAPLFANGSIGGLLTLDDSIAPGESFGADAILGLSLSFGGISGSLADIAASAAPGGVQAFGTLSADGRSLSVFDLRFGFPDTVAGCSFVCAGQIIIDSPIGGGDVSNFIAIDDLDAASLSVISSYTARFQAVPEPATWALFIAGFGLAGAALRRRGLAPQTAR
jgi:hypothetical protein